MFKGFLKDKIKIIAPTVGIILVVGTVVFVGTRIKKVNEKTASTESLATAYDAIKDETISHIVALAPDANALPSLDVNLPTLEPAPDLLRNGVKHDIIKKLQQRLMDLGFMEHDEPTDYFGDVTELAVRAFQRQNLENLTQESIDGIVGPETLAAIMDPDAKYYAAQKNDDGKDIERIQERLYQLGYLASRDQVTGHFGDSTEAAVKKFQARNDATEDGKVGMETYNLLYSDDVKANMLEYGEKSEVVLAMQKILQEKGYLTREADGTYGKDTNLAVKRFQEKNSNLVSSADGYLGPETREALLNPASVNNGWGLGDSGDQISNIQNLLSKHGYLSKSNVTGYFGETTESAVKSFQARNSLTSDGSVGTKTIAKLNATSVVGPPRETPRRSNNSSGGGSKKSNSSSGGAPANVPVYSGGGSVGNLLAVASSKIGTPYVWGAKGPSSFDCSGFVHWALNNAGVRQSYLTSSGWRNVGKYTRISNFSDLQAGDIVVVRGHVGIAAGGGQVIDASSSNGRVVRRSLSGWWQNNFIVGWRIF